MCLTGQLCANVITVDVRPRAPHEADFLPLPPGSRPFGAAHRARTETRNHYRDKQPLHPHPPVQFTDMTWLINQSRAIGTVEAVPFDPRPAALPGRQARV